MLAPDLLILVSLAAGVCALCGFRGLVSLLTLAACACMWTHPLCGLPDDAFKRVVRAACRTTRATPSGSLMPETPDVDPCPRCQGECWICEAHLDRPWPHDDCAGPGEPCPLCNDVTSPELPADWTSLL